MEPLADLLLEYRSEALVQLAQDFVDIENVATVEDAIAGARDILAERFADDASIRQKIRTFSWKEGILTTALKNAELDEKRFLKCITNMKSLLTALFLIVF